MKVDLELSVNTEDLLWSLRSVDMDVLIEFVKELDRSVGDWDFTRALVHYFDDEYDRLLEERILSNDA